MILTLFKAGVATACAYEVVAIVTDKVPTISEHCAQRPPLIPAVLGGLAVHLCAPLLGQTPLRKVRA